MTIEEAFVDEIEKMAGVKALVKIPRHFVGGVREGLKSRKLDLAELIEAVKSKSFKAGYPVGKMLRKAVDFLKRK